MLNFKINCRHFRSSIHVQCCIILSEMKRHEDAIIHAKFSLKLQYKIFVDSLLINFYIFFQTLEKIDYGKKMLELYEKSQ